jgi:hypothetical protein
MSYHSLVLILHVSAVFALWAVLVIEMFSFVRLRSASTLAEVHTWMDSPPKLPVIAVGSVLLIFLSGIYLVHSISRGQAWPKIAVSALLLMAPLGAATGRRMRAIRHLYPAAKALGPELRGQIQDPFLKISLCVRMALFFGIFLLVSAKPGLLGSLGILGTSLILGLLASRLGWRRGERRPVVPK